MGNSRYVPIMVALVLVDNWLNDVVQAGRMLNYDLVHKCELMSHVVNDALLNSLTELGSIRELPNDTQCKYQYIFHVVYNGLLLQDVGSHNLCLLLFMMAMKSPCMKSP